MQRFGLTRIYGRKVGTGQRDARDGGCSSRGSCSRSCGSAADPATPGRVARLPLGDGEHGVGGSPDDVASAGGRARAARDRRRRLRSPSRGSRREYGRARRRRGQPGEVAVRGIDGSAVRVDLVDPVAGFIALRRRAFGRVLRDRPPLARHAATPTARAGRSAPPCARTHGRPSSSPATSRRSSMLVVAASVAPANPDAYLFAVLFLGGLHVFYDGFIWKLRRPAVARGLVSARSPANVERVEHRGQRQAVGHLALARRCCARRRSAPTRCARPRRDRSARHVRRAVRQRDRCGSAGRTARCVGW